MSALINRVKDHISDNRGKYGAAAGAGAMYGASKIDSPLVNQAGFNILAKGQNLALDTAAKIDPRATTALNDLGMHKIRPEDIDASNALYNSGVAKYINPNPVDMVNANEHSTEAYNKAMAMKANAEDTLVNAKNQGQDYLDQGINYVKGLNPFSESTISIPIKNMLLEGYQPEEITEGIIGDTFNKYKKPIIAGAMAGFMGATGNNIYQGSFSPTAQHHNNQIEIASKNIPSLKEYAHLSTKQLDDHINEKYKNDPAGKVKLAGEILSDKPTLEALLAKNGHIEGLNNQYLKRDLPLGILGGSLAIGGLAAGMRRRSKQH